MRSAEASSGRLSGITVAIRQVWTPEECPVELLPYLAWALSVDQWDKDWPAEKKDSGNTAILLASSPEGHARSCAASDRGYGILCRFC